VRRGGGGVAPPPAPPRARRARLFVNKAWGYGDRNPDHYFPALNYRLTELQGAVALAQLPKLDWVVARRREVAARIGEALGHVPGLALPGDPPGGRHSWWKYAFQVDPRVVEGGAERLGRRMQERGVACVPRYIQKPAFECQVFSDLRSSPVSAMPLLHNPRRDRSQPLFVRADYPGAVRALERVVVLPINELYTHEHVRHVTQVIAAEARVLAHA
jgi:dTDP-4-amino-4,6-dideoxygalactose transaminase